MAQAEKQVTEDLMTSQIFDGDLSLNAETDVRLDEQKFARYALIGDVMRSQKQDTPCIDITSSFAAALEQEQTYSEPSEQVKETTPKSNVIELSAWRKPFAQVAIAASVSLFAVLGVNTLSTDATIPAGETLQLQSTPFAGGVSPVSLSTEPALESAAKGIRELQQQRIGALVLEHQRQSRMAYALQQSGENNTAEKQEEKEQ
ncbi:MULTISPECIES: sigma-E factor negative regulatory protein [Pseudoalteromonas]|uniref:sigma-E factor negative regulatory protein n=1 Tax=Pseudoalteromonas TaxID=53246 RepID=UPI000FFF4B23|nr:MULTISPECIES: RseA family anti-sigma factor [Pseudoalteromonas]MCG9757717.1 anti-sigma 24 factor [Pseudoalteromonas sp. Isolate6]NKC19221.1 anti-sigma 24 factor [Pseudoalteromonas galatheae]RXE87200.1 anti-sigma 24 factor [Pseudoalteromonas sp. A757]